MTGRGDGWLIHPSPSPSVTIGLTLSTSPLSLPLSSKEPFYVILTARILSSPHPDQPITLQIHPSPLDGLSNRSFHNIVCTTKPEKEIEILPCGWPHYFWDSEDLESAWPFVSISPKDQSSYSVRHEVPRDKIEAVDPQKGAIQGDFDKQMLRYAVVGICRSRGVGGRQAAGMGRAKG